MPKGTGYPWKKVFPMKEKRMSLPEKNYAGKVTCVATGGKLPIRNSF